MTKLQILKYLIKHKGNCSEANRGTGVPYAFTCHNCPLGNCGNLIPVTCPPDAEVEQIAETMLKDILANKEINKMLRKK